MTSSINIVSPVESCCENQTIFQTPDGMFVCRNCGMVLGPAIENSARRSYTREESMARQQNEPAWREFGARTEIPRSSSDANGNALPPNKRNLFIRLSKINRSLMTSNERNFWEAKPKMRAVASALTIPDHVYQTAWKIYLNVVRKHLTMGRSISAFVSASIYASIRVHGFPRMLDEVVEASRVKKRLIHRALAHVTTAVLPEMGYAYRPLKPNMFVYRFGNELDIPIQFQKEASDLIKIAMKKGSHVIGKDPKGIAVSALYLVMRSTRYKRTQTEFADAARITEVTIRSRVRELIPLLELVPSQAPDTSDADQHGTVAGLAGDEFDGRSNRDGDFFQHHSFSRWHRRR